MNVNPKQTLTTSMGGSCIELTRTPPVTVAAVKIKAAQLPRSIELGVSLGCHILQQAVKYLGFYSDVKLDTSDALPRFMLSKAATLVSRNITYRL